MPIFKTKTLQEPGPKKRMWKSLKQIQTTERNLFGLNSDAVFCEFDFANSKVFPVSVEVFCPQIHLSMHHLHFDLRKNTPTSQV